MGQQAGLLVRIRGEEGRTMRDLSCLISVKKRWEVHIGNLMFIGTFTINPLTKITVRQTNQQRI